MARPTKHALSAEELARLAGISTATWKEHERAGCPTPKRRQDVQGWLPKYHQWRAQVRRVSGPAPAALGNPDDARWTTERKKWLAMAAKADFAERMGRLIDRDVVVAYAGRAVLTVRNRLNDLVRKLSPRFFNAPSPEWIEEEFQAEVDAICATFERGMETPRTRQEHDDDEQQQATAGTRTGDQSELAAADETDGE